MDKVHFHIFRKSSFAGCLLPQRIYINGEFVGSLRNGKSIDITVERAKLYYIEDRYEGKNGYLLDDNSEAYNITIKRSGGCRTASYNEYFLLKSNQLKMLPSFDFRNFSEAIYDKLKFNLLNADEKILARCLEFDVDFHDDIDALLCNEHYYEMLGAIHKIGAVSIYSSINDFVREQFSRGEVIPFDDTPDTKEYEYKTNIGNKILINAQKNGEYDEFYKCMIMFICNKLL